MKLLIEIWGNYYAWKKVTYTYNNTTRESPTTLPLLLKTIEPDKTLIIVADTLLEYEIANNKFSIDGNNENWYFDACDIVKQETYNFIKKSIANNDSVSINNSIHVLVTPGTGTFAHSIYTGNPHNFFSYLYYYMVKTAVALAPDNNETVEVYLDITHGINYMTMITYRTIKDICAILRYFFDITFIVLNSDPFVGSENVNLHINVIEKIKLTPQLNIFKYSQDNSKWLKVSKNMDDSQKDSFNKILQEKIKEKLDTIIHNNRTNWYCFASAAYHGLPLYLMYFFPDIQKLTTAADTIVTLFFDHYALYSCNNKIIFQQQVDFTPHFISLLQILLFAKYLNGKYSITQQNECNIQSLDKLKKVYEHNSTITSRIHRELDKIKKASPEVNYADYGFLVMKKEKKEYEPSSNVDERNFFAHAGFGYNNVQLKKEDSTIFIKPKNECVNTIKTILMKTVPTGVL